MRRWTLAVLAGCSVATGCTSLVAPVDAAEPADVWTFRNFSWGRQCEDKDMAREQPAQSVAGAKASPDAGTPALEQQVNACFQPKASRESAVECTAKAVAAAGIAVREKRTETMSVCEACGCPANALRLHLLVAPKDQAALEAAGFKVRSRPPPPAE